LNFGESKILKYKINYVQIKKNDL